MQLLIQVNPQLQSLTQLALSPQPVVSYLERVRELHPKAAKDLGMNDEVKEVSIQQVLTIKISTKS